MSCTICGSTDVSILIPEVSGAQIFTCGGCDNAFTWPKPTLPDYRSADFQSREGSRVQLTLMKDIPVEIEQSYRIQCEMILRHVPLGASVLEIGGGEGIFLEMLKKVGYDVELTEPSRSAAMRARLRGLIVYEDYFQSIDFKKKYSVICMAHVLEHMDNPVTVLAGLRELLIPGGIVLLTQTNFRGLMPRRLKNKWYAWVPDQHFSHFSVSGMQHIASSVNAIVLGHRYSRLVHGKSISNSLVRFIPFLQDQFHIALQFQHCVT
jgi:2-polyprenyl-3-methyl-5-hydroxy-6-metoxy-1,4-benzoquinol methylase